MMKLDEIQKRLLLEVADLHEIPEGAYNIRSNSQSAGRQSTANIEITSKQEVSGLEVRIKPGTKRESVHIPVVMTESGLKEVVYNDFFVGADASTTEPGPPIVSVPVDEIAVAAVVSTAFSPSSQSCASPESVMVFDTVAPESVTR